jgi:hypothetical protein
LVCPDFAIGHALVFPTRHCHLFYDIVDVTS